MSPHACWVRAAVVRGPANWEPATFHAWDLQPESSGAVVEMADGSLEVVNLGRLRFKPPPPRPLDVASPANPGDDRA